MTLVLDASALLAYLQDEPGADEVYDVLDRAVMSSVNLSEVAVRIGARGIDPGPVLDDVLEFGLDVVDFTFACSRQVVEVHTAERRLGARLSLGDRCCLATALNAGLPVLTADREWLRFEDLVAIRLIR